jgi:hypothetical protein
MYFARGYSRGHISQGDGSVSSLIHCPLESNDLAYTSSQPPEHHCAVSLLVVRISYWRMPMGKQESGMSRRWSSADLQGLMLPMRCSRLVLGQRCEWVSGSNRIQLNISACPVSQRARVPVVSRLDMVKLGQTQIQVSQLFLNVVLMSRLYLVS